MSYYKTIRKGFTLVEMLIVVVIIGILAAALIPRVQSAQSRARDVARIAHMKDISTALELYSFDSASYPTGSGYAINTSGYITSADTEWKNSFQDQLSPYIKSVPTDPQDSRAYVYGYVYNTPASYYRLYADYELKASDKGLLGYRNMETLSGAKLRDMSGNGNEGTINGANFVGGIVGGAMNFDGVDDYVQISDSDLFHFGTNNFGVVIWFKPEGNFNNYDVIFSKSNGLNHNRLVNALFIANGQLRWTVNGYMDSDLWGEYVLYGTATNLMSTRHHVGLIRENNIIKGYLDGMLKSTYTLNNSNYNFTSNESITLGNESSVGTPYQGTIDEVRIYNRALSASEIKDLYNSRK